MTIQELLDNINALGIGVGSDAEDVLERDLATDVRLPALINRGVADLFRVRPARGVVVVDLAGKDSDGNYIMQSDGTVNVYNALTAAAKPRFERLDAFSFASEDEKQYGITANAWTSDRYVRVGAASYVKRIQAANAYIDANPFTVTSWNGTQYSVVERGKDANRYNGTKTTVYLDVKANSNPAVADTDGRSVVLVALGTTPETYYQYEEPTQVLVTITYRMKPATITVNDIGNAENKTFDDILDEGLCDLLPLFVASKLYLEEDPGKANQFRSEYEARRNEILAREYNHPEASRFVLTNGW